MASLDFAPIVLNALYPSIERGLSADILAGHALGGEVYPICTSHLVAGHGRVTDVLEVPADTVASQLEHVFATAAPTGAKLSIAGGAASVDVAAKLLGLHLHGPILLDLTLSGPSGEDLADGRVRDALVERLPLANVVSIRKVDAELVVGMEITDLDDAQVAVQRLHRRGARAVILRVGRLDRDEAGETMATDLVYDGDDFALFEAPWLDGAFHGASSALHLALLRALTHDVPLLPAMQQAKAFATEALRHRRETAHMGGLAYFPASQAAISSP